ncbi:MAG: Crp/Fnr family transcriptional regulator [Amphritea sp.]
MNKQQAEQDFLEYFSRAYGVLEASSFADLGIQGELRYYQKGEWLIRQGETAPQLFYLISGLARYLSVSPEGKEFTQSFALAPGLAGSTRAMVRKTPAMFSIEALEDIICLEFDWQHLFNCIKQDIGFLETYAHMMETLFIGKEERENSFVHQSAEQRYLYFIEQKGELLDRVPLQYIASYIGITPVALSRIRKKLK